MMEQTINQTNKRAKRIHTVEMALIKVNNSKRILDYNKFSIMICEQFNCSERTTREYMRIAKSRIKDWQGDDWK